MDQSPCQAVRRNPGPSLGYLGSHVGRRDLESVIAAEIGSGVGRSQSVAGWGKEGRRTGLVAEVEEVVEKVSVVLTTVDDVR